MTHLTDELLDAAADGETLEPGYVEHLTACDECRAQVARLRSLRAQLAALPRSIENGTDSWPQLRDRMRARRAPWRRYVTVPVLALAAAVLFAVIRVGMLPEHAPPQAAAQSELAELRSVVPPVVIDAMAANLTVYDSALEELEAHAAADRENPDLQQRIDDLRRKRAALLRLATNS